MSRSSPQTPGRTGWRPWGRRRRRRPGEGGDGQPADPLLEVGRQVRQARESRGKSLRQLALETRISTQVLEALEKGWRDRLPEAAYLRTMLRLIEQNLDLASGSLEPVLPQPSLGGRLGADGRPQAVAPDSIEVFSTWQGTLLYAGLMLGMIYVLNLLQLRIAAGNLLSLRPIPPLPPAERQRPAEAGGLLLRLYPELRPLRRAEQGQGLTALRAGTAAPAGGGRNGSAAAASAPGLLELNLSRPSTVNLSSEGGTSTSLEGAIGDLSLTLQPPLRLQISPAPAAAEVRWNGQPLAASSGQPELFVLPQAPQP